VNLLKPKGLLWKFPYWRSRIHADLWLADSTKDVDALVHPSGVAKKLAVEVAKELELPEDWLNDQVRLFLAEKGGEAPIGR